MPTRNAASSRHASYYLLVLRKAEILYQKGGKSVLQGIQLFNQEWSNISIGQAWAEHISMSDSKAAIVCSYYAASGANLLNLLQPPKERIFWLESAVNAAKKLKDAVTEAIHLNNLGLAYAALGEFNQAIRYYKESLLINRNIGNRRGEGSALGNLGGAYFALRDFEQSIEFYQQRLSIAREISDRKAEGRALGNLGVNFKSIGDFERAIEFHRQDLAISQEIGDRRGEGAVWGNLGTIHRKLRDFKQALVCHSRRLEIARDLNELSGEATALYNLSLVFNDLSERRKAVIYAKAALLKFEQFDSRFIPKVKKQLDAWQEHK